MDIDPAATLIGLRAAQTQQLARIAIARKQHEMEMDLAARLAEVARAVPPPGAGTRVDRIA